MSDRFELYEARPQVTNALKRLGVRLAARSALDADEQRLYEDFIGDAADRTRAAQTLIQRTADLLEPVFGSGFEVVGRVKTRNTLADKLERTPAEKLPSVHDVAGIRLVHPGGTFAQDLIVSATKRLFDANVLTSRPARLVDRRQHPSHGYRAVHVIAWPHGRPIEVQVRSELQHAWAQVMELIGDRWGREPRYGLPVAHPDEGERIRRQAAVDALIALSDEIADHERELEAADLFDIDLQPIQEYMPPETLRAVIAVKKTARPLERRRHEGVVRIRESLNQLRQILDA